MTASARRDEIQRHIAGPSAPAAVQAERALIGLVLANNDALEQIDTLPAAHFYDPLHGRLWDAILKHHASGTAPDPMILDGQFANDETYRTEGGIIWLSNLAEVAPGPARAPAYVTAIREAAQRRNIARLAEDLQKAVVDGEASAEDLIAKAKTGIDAIELDGATADATVISAPDAADKAIAEMRERAMTGRARGLTVGLRCIDKRLNGLKPGAVVVVGGRPGMGKTALLRAILHGAAVHNPHHLFPLMGLEMGPMELIHRDLSAITHELGQGVPYRAMDDAALTPLDFEVIDDARRRVPPNLLLDDCPALSVGDVRRKVWALGRKGKVGAVGIDYLQLMSRPEVKGRNDAALLGDMTKGLKHIARRAGVCIILLSQLSRQVESRDDKRPRMDDLRDSGAIEQDADAILFPFREHYYLERAEPKAGTDKHLDWEMRCQDTRRLLEVVCAKQRQGPVGTDRQSYIAEFDFIEDDHD